MDWLRNLLLVAILAVVGLLFVRWLDFREARQVELEAVAQTQVEAGEIAEAIPRAPTAGVADHGTAVQSADLLTVETDALRLAIDLRGGDIVRAELLRFRQTLEPDSPPVVILDRSDRGVYVAQSGLVGPDGVDSNRSRPLYRASARHFSLAPGQEELVVELEHRRGEVRVVKEFRLRRGDYLVQIALRVENGTERPLQMAPFGQILRDDQPPPAADGFGMKPYLGAALTTPEKRYLKVPFSELDDGPFVLEMQGGWVAMVQHYFLSAWVPDPGALNRYTLKRLGDRKLYALGFVGPSATIAAGGTTRFDARFYVGPKDQDRLAEIAPYLDLTVDYGWLWWLAKPIFHLLAWIQSLVGNWGWAIVILTVAIKLAFYQLSAASYRSMAKMRKLQPEMQRLKELYGDDRQKLSQAVMELYRKEKVNPLGGCLPVLVQMPVFIALYWVLFESVELRHAPWILWIRDLSSKDPYFVLPILNGICMYATTLLQPEPPDPTQAKLMRIMPVAFSFLFALFPAGLVLYWTVNSLLSIFQQWAITRKVEGKERGAR
ncbi:MAG: membrane protein insertase YidC [Porticoccaceae bacterium]|nr:MAG: membrane protein insertase YidC [Porticoccaceae bacterium]